MPPLVFVYQGALFFAFFTGSGWHFRLSVLCYICPGCGELETLWQ